jgi:hypothetical protein
MARCYGCSGNHSKRPILHYFNPGNPLDGKESRLIKFIACVVLLAIAGLSGAGAIYNYPSWTSLAFCVVFGFSIVKAGKIIIDWVENNGR